MGKFLTSHSRFEQLNTPEKWKLIDNQLYKDDDGTIYLCPRNYITDGFTIPSLLSFIAGSKMKYDTRASSQHDFECSYHKVIVVLMSEEKLSKMSFLHAYNELIVCENIPVELLEVRDTSFQETNKRFLRMLQSVNNIPKWRAELMYKAVNFNVGWLFSKHRLDLTRLYEVNYDLLRQNHISLDSWNKFSMR